MSAIVYPKRPRNACVTWTYLFKLPGGHKYFQDPDGFIAVADRSGGTPDTTEAGCLYVRTDLPIRIGQSAAIDVIDTEGESYVVVESAENGLDLANRLKMTVNGHRKTYRLVEVTANKEVEAKPGSCLAACKHMLVLVKKLLDVGGRFYSPSALELDAELLRLAIANEEGTA